MTTPFVSCGTYDHGDGCSVELFTDQRCTRCGHPACPWTPGWCDNGECLAADDDDPKRCASLECSYTALPQFTYADGRPYDGDAEPVRYV